MMWQDLFRYEDGKLYWLPREGTHPKQWNTRFAGKEAGYVRPDGYVAIRYNDIQRMAHRIIYEMHYGEIPEGMVIDHINFNPSDNRIENLQLVTNKQNVGRRNQTSKGYRVHKQAVTRPYHAGRTDKYFGTACGAYMSFMTALL